MFDALLLMNWCKSTVVCAVSKSKQIHCEVGQTLIDRICVMSACLEHQMSLRVSLTCGKLLHLQLLTGKVLVHYISSSAWMMSI